jgi:alginate O-acetyltransferase complex protein AlgI
MQFASARFGVFFLIVTTVAWFGPPRLRKPWLVLASLGFYAAADPRWIPVLGVVATVAFVVGRRMETRKSRSLLAAAVACELSILGLFKYWEFGRSTLADLLGALGIDSPMGFLEPGLPLGISFYTFQCIAFVVDRYRGQVSQPTVVDFGLYVAYFPKLLIGPLVKPRDFLARLAAPPEAPNTSAAIALIAVGWFKKAILATMLGEGLVDRAFGSPDGCSSVELWVGCYAYSIQLVCDFSGYTDLARGFSALLGYPLPENFQSPYLATSLGDFWRRWHRSFSAWLRDYLFIPLGGSQGTSLQTARNLLITMTLGGLWHGASWNFVLWGAGHGVLLVAERAWRSTEWRPPLPRVILDVTGWCFTFHTVVLLRILFRTADLATAARYVDGMRAGTLVGQGIPLTVFLCLILGFSLDALGANAPSALARLHDRLPWAARPLVWAAATVAGLALLPDAIPPYIYFGF